MLEKGRGCQNGKGKNIWTKFFTNITPLLVFFCMEYKKQGDTVQIIDNFSKYWRIRSCDQLFSIQTESAENRAIITDYQQCSKGKNAKKERQIEDSKIIFAVVFFFELKKPEQALRVGTRRESRLEELLVSLLSFFSSCFNTVSTSRKIVNNPVDELFLTSSQATTKFIENKTE